MKGFRNNKLVEINKEQYKLLKYINKKGTIYCDQLTSDELDICKYLFKNDLINRTTKTISKRNNDYVSLDVITDSYSINQDGKAQISAFKSTFYKTRTSLIMSIFSTVAAIVSTIVSIIALLKP